MPVRDVFRRFRPSDPLAWTGLLGLQAIWLVMARLWAGVGWGWTPRLVSDGTIRPGWMTNLPDSLSYASWMEQARNGSALAGLLYTTSPHPHVYFNPLLWCAGTLSRIVGGAPTGWLNLAALAGALLCTALVHAIALRLDLGARAAFWSAAITAFGSGSSWLSILLADVSGLPAIRGADLRFMDLLPSSAALVYPFHTLGFALVALLWWLTLRLEQAAVPRAVPGAALGTWLVTASVAALLAVSRPYEPAAFVGVYGVYTLSALVRSRHRPAGLVRLQIWCTVTLGVAPGLAYAWWLSSQPVWREFASLSMNLGHARSFWLVGFGALWLLAALGLPRMVRHGPSPREFPVCWCLFLAGWLLILNQSQAKLAAGGGLALALVSGAALAQGITWLMTPPRPARLALAGLAVALLTGPASLLALVHESALFPPHVDYAFLIIARQLRPAPDQPPPTVLCELQAGAALPGLAGVRVVCGHWSLTDHYDVRRQWLVDAGLEASTPVASLPSRQMERLRELAFTEGCDYLLLSAVRPVAALVALDTSFEALPAPVGWLLYRIRPRPALR